MPVPSRPELTSEEIVSLASSLRDVGVSRFTMGDLSFEFEPCVPDVPEAQEEPPAELTPMEKAAMRLGSRGRAA